MRPRISIRGSVRPSVGRSVGRSVRPSVRWWRFRKKTRKIIIFEQIIVVSSSRNLFIIMRTHRWPYGPCLFINERHGFLEINRMVFSFLFLHVCRMTYFLIFLFFYWNTKKITFSPWRNWIWKQNDTEKMIYEKNSRFIFFILDSMFCFCCVYYFLRVSDARNENYQEIIADAYFGEFEGITYKCLFVNA